MAREDGRERGREGEKGGVKDGGGRRKEEGKGEDMGTQWNPSAHRDKERLIELEPPSIVNDQITARQRVLQ